MRGSSCRAWAPECTALAPNLSQHCLTRPVGRRAGTDRIGTSGNLTEGHMKFFQTFLTLREKIAFLLYAVAFLTLSYLFVNDAHGDSGVLFVGLILILSVTGYWIIGGILSRQSYMQNSRWQKGKTLALSSVFLTGGLFIGRESAIRNSSSALIFDLGFRMMLVGTFLTNQLLLIYARYHGHQEPQQLNQN
jgi:hypothetical protein